MGSGTTLLRMLKPDPMPTADRDGQPYLKAAKLGQHAVLPLPWLRTSGDAGPYLKTANSPTPYSLFPIPSLPFLPTLPACAPPLPS